MDGIDRIVSIPGVKIELYPLVDAPLAHEHQQERGRRQTEPAHDHDQGVFDDSDSESEDNGAYDDHGHLIHDHGEEPPPDISHINIVV